MNIQKNKENMEDTSVDYRIIKDNQDKWAILIDNGRFENFVFRIEHLRLTYKTKDGKLKLVKSYEDVEDEEITMDFQYELSMVPENYKSEENDQKLFETIAENILIDILANYPETYKLESDEHKIDFKQSNKE